MKIAGWTTVIYGIIVFIGGLIGYAVAGSMASVVAGVASSILLLGSGIGVVLGKRSAIIAALAVTLFLDGFFSYRFMLSFSFMPTGMMASLSLIALVIQVVALRTTAGSRRAS